MATVNVPASDKVVITANTSAVAQFLQYTPQGTVDLKKTMKFFEDHLRAALKAQEDIKPTILQLLKEYPKLGEGSLIAFTTYALKMPKSGETDEIIKSAIRDLEAANQIAYQTNDNGTRKGKNSGWKLATA